MTATPNPAAEPSAFWAGLADEVAEQRRGEWWAADCAECGRTFIGEPETHWCDEEAR